MSLFYVLQMDYRKEKFRTPTVFSQAFDIGCWNFVVCLGLSEKQSP